MADLPFPLNLILQPSPQYSLLVLPVDNLSPLFSPIQFLIIKRSLCQSFLSVSLLCSHTPIYFYISFHFSRKSVILIVNRKQGFKFQRALEIKVTAHQARFQWRPSRGPVLICINFKHEWWRKEENLKQSIFIKAPSVYLSRVHFNFMID